MKKLLLLFVTVGVVVGLQTLRSTQDTQDLPEEDTVVMEQDDDADTVKSEFVECEQNEEISGGLVGSGGTRF